jgi:hypothetical protein
MALLSKTKTVFNAVKQYVLEPCQIPTSIDINLLKEYVVEYMKPRQTFYKETNRSFSIEDEFSEWWTAKASSGEQIGKGHEATDVITSNKEGIDAMCVIMNEKETNEKSLIQNFNTSGFNLDSLFENKDHESAIKLFVNELNKKLQSVVIKHTLSSLYILSYISLDDSIYICCFKYNIELLDNVVSNGFTKQGQSIFAGGFIDEKYGNVKLYKAKKRMELRLYKSCITDNPFAYKIY